MKRLVVFLFSTTLLFAASTAYLAVELHKRPPVTADAGSREESPARTGSAVETALGSSDANSLATRAAPAASGTGALDPVSDPATTAPGATTASPANDVDPTLPFARQFLARYDDLTQRGVLMDEARTTLRRQYRRLKEQLGLSDPVFEQLVTVLAEQYLAGQERWARCATTAGCDLNDPSRAPPPVDEREQEFLALLGAEGASTLNQYRDTLAERDSVAQFRGRLSDHSFLPEAQAERLVAALVEERKRYSEELAQQGQRVTGWGTNLGMLWFPEDLGSVDAQIAESAQYSARLRARAAQFLTAEQFAAFVQMQEELLAQLAMLMRPPPRKSNQTKLAQG